MVRKVLTTLELVDMITAVDRLISENVEVGSTVSPVADRIELLTEFKELEAVCDVLSPKSVKTSQVVPCARGMFSDQKPLAHI